MDTITKIHAIYVGFFLLFVFAGTVWSQTIKTRREQPAGMAGGFTLILFPVLTGIFFSARLHAFWWISLSWLVGLVSLIGYSVRYTGLIIRRRNNL